MELDPKLLVERRKMVEELRRSRVLRSSSVEEALLSVPRHYFVPSALQDSAYHDTPLPIGKGQTISAPHMVAIMLEAAPISPGMRVLEVGSGSGYQAAVMGHLVKPRGHVYTVERISEMAESARCSVARSGLEEFVTIIHGDGSTGLGEHAPYDRIFVTCGAPSLPTPLGEQLADGGMMLVPEGDLHLQVLTEYRKKNGSLLKRKRETVLFVPMIGEHGWKP